MDQTLRYRVNAGRAAVRAQIELFRRQFGSVVSQWKADDTRVTFVDFAISEKIFAALRADFEQDHFCSEESNPADEVVELSTKYAWILDPIDGTNNYALGFPYCAISLALLKNGVPVYGFIYDHARSELVEGGPGLPLLVNGLRQSPQTRPFERKQGIIALHFPIATEDLGTLGNLLSGFRVRSLGSGALHLLYAALGRLDGCYDHKVKVWDIAAAIAIAGCCDCPVHFMTAHLFPLKSFHVDMPFVRYYAGSKEFCHCLEQLDWQDLNVGR
ncbi:MAG: inositol monophosphatase [Verrucomicrobia bacterium]|nr:inositol monophosphatase [Verrucomicrobiota bacterium]